MSDSPSGPNEPGWAGAVRIFGIVICLLLVAAYCGKHGWSIG